MITAVDSSILIDVLIADRIHGAASREALRTCLKQGGLIACEVVWAEVAGSFPGSDEVRQALERLGVTYSPIALPAALAAGAAWRQYRRRDGQGTRVIADFLIGAHANRSADRLLCRDGGFYRSYFAELAILDPSTA